MSVMNLIKHRSSVSLSLSVYIKTHPPHMGAQVTNKLPAPLFFSTPFCKVRYQKITDFAERCRFYREKSPDFCIENICRGPGQRGTLSEGSQSGLRSRPNTEQCCFAGCTSPASPAAKTSCPLGSHGCLPLYHGHWKLELLAVAGGNGTHADQPRRADER